MLNEQGGIMALDITGTTEREEPQALVCLGCKHVYPATSINLDGLCVGCERRAKKYDIFTEVENARLEKPRGKCVIETMPNGQEWKV